MLQLTYHSTQRTMSTRVHVSPIPATRNERIVVALPGKLGLTLANAPTPYSGGTVVVKVSPASVLVDLISPGDWITKIDEEDVSQLDFNTVTSIISSKRESERVLTLLYSPQILPLLKLPTPTDDRKRKRSPVQDDASKVARIGGSNPGKSCTCHDILSCERSIGFLTHSIAVSSHLYTRTPPAIPAYSTNALTRTSPSLGLEVETSAATLISAVAPPSEYDSSVLGGNENTIDVTHYAEQLLTPYSTSQTLFYEETPQHQWMDKALHSYFREEFKRNAQDALKLLRLFKGEPVEDECVASGVSEFDAQWNEKFEQLLNYIIEHGNSKVRQGNPLWDWVRANRRRMKNGMLSQPRFEQLDAVGFEWIQSLGPNTPWDERKRQLHKFIVDKGHAIVPRDDPILGLWVNYGWYA